jgi:hypothetical protein
MNALATINQLVEYCTAVAKDKGWGWPTEKTKDHHFLGSQLMLVVSECSEALEDVRKNHLITQFKDENGNIYESIDHDQPTLRIGPLGTSRKPVGFPTELADIVIRCFHIAGEMEIDLAKEIIVKMAYNSMRSFRHENKTL